MNNYINLTAEIARVESALTMIRRMIESNEIPELLSFEPVNFIMLSGACIGITIPYDHHGIKQNRVLLENSGWVYSDQHMFTDDATYAEYYSRHGIRLNIYYQAQHKEATCRVNLISEETKTIPVLEIVCNQE